MDTLALQEGELNNDVSPNIAIEIDGDEPEPD